MRGRINSIYTAELNKHLIAYRECTKFCFLFFFLAISGLLYGQNIFHHYSERTCDVVVRTNKLKGASGNLQSIWTEEEEQEGGGGGGEEEISSLLKLLLGGFSGRSNDQLDGLRTPTNITSPSLRRYNFDSHQPLGPDGFYLWCKDTHAIDLCTYKHLILTRTTSTS